MQIKKGSLVELKIQKYAFEGKGIAKVAKSKLAGEEPPGEEENYIVFVNGAFPQDVVKATLKKIKKAYAEADTVEIISPSPERVEPACKYFGSCGGCRQQNLSYESQLKYKQQQVVEIFEKLEGFSDLQVEDIIPSDNIYYYRNKMEFSFTEKRWLTKSEIASGHDMEINFALGLHVPKVYEKVLDIDECFLQSEQSNQILNFTREFFKARRTSIYSTKTHQGYLRNLVIRQAYNTKDLMVNLVTAAEYPELMKEYSSALLNIFPAITTIVNNINLKKASVAVGDYDLVYHGNGFIYEKIGGYNFRISANSFFQTNTLQAEKLFKTALDFAAPEGNEVVYDLYSGAGTIASYISDHCKMVFGFESEKSAVTDAEENLKQNNIQNVKCFVTDLYDSFIQVLSEQSIPKPDVVIADPPRSGMHKNTVMDILSLKPDKIVYVSCNPATQVRDIKIMTDAGYKLLKIRPVDMFPHTWHIENVAILKRVV